MWPSGSTASRATRIHARSTTWALRANKPVRGQVNAWSPSKSTGPPQPGDGPQRPEAIGSGKRSRRRNATCMASGESVVASSPGIAASQAPACGPDWERSRARWSGGKLGNSTRSHSRGCESATRGIATHAASLRGLVLHLAPPKGRPTAQVVPQQCWAIPWPQGYPFMIYKTVKPSPLPTSRSCECGCR